MKKILQKKIMTTAVIIVAVILMATIFLNFRRRMDEMLDATTATYLSGNADALAAAFETKLEDQLIMLESQTRYFSDVDLTDYNAMKETIMSTRGMEAFTSIGVASSAGSTMSYQGKSSGNIYLRDYFKRAMAGENAISEEPVTDEFGNEVLVLAVPIFHEEGNVVGVIYGTFTKDALSEMLKTVQFGEESASVLTTGDGTILARSSASGLISAESNNIQDAIPGLELSAASDGQPYKYKSDGRDNVLMLRRIGVHNWYFGMIVPYSVVSEQSDNILRRVVFALIEVAFVMSGLLLYIYLSGRQHENEKQKLEEKAQTDSLTRILNKISFQEAVDSALKSATDQELCALYIIDLDDFKQVNDSLGHATGDKVLVDVANKLQEIFRDTDLTGRIGGDEFAAFLRCPKDRVSDMEGLMKNRAETIIKDLKEVYAANGIEVQVSASVGLACYPSQGRDFDTLYKNADKALYSAKRGGKDRYETYE